MTRAALAVALLAACGGAGDREPSFRFTQPEPGGVTEVYRRGVQPFAVAWDTDATAADALDVVLRLDGTSPAGATYASPPFPLADGAGAWSLDDGRPGSFRLTAELRDRADGSTLATATHGGIVIAQGIELRDTELTFTAATTERDIWVQTSTASVMVLDLVAIPDTAPTTRVSLGRASVASDLAPVGRVFAWDTALPAGTYTIAGDISAAGDSIHYRDGSSRVTWTP
ncbi:MAG TPA: hypothetical protein VM261_38275 [Kofleriaceae bacterium]|nr:hypothetical protein [Kofleriaceae bacterium]